MTRGKIFTLSTVIYVLLQAHGLEAGAACIPCYRGENLWCFTKRIAQELCAVKAESESCCASLQEQIEAGGAAAQSCCDRQAILIEEALSCCDDVRGALESCCQELQSQIDAGDLAAESCCAHLQSQINVLDEKIESCCDSQQSCFNHGCLIFTPFDLSSNSGVNPNIQLKPYGSAQTVAAWKMPRASATQNPLQLQFQVPCDFDQTSSFVQVNLHIMIGREGATVPSYFKIQMKANFKNNENIGTAFDQTVSSPDILVAAEPALMKQYNHVLVTIQLPTAFMAARDWAILSFDRIAPTGRDYNKDIFLTVVSLDYTKKCTVDTIGDVIDEDIIV